MTAPASSRRERRNVSMYSPRGGEVRAHLDIVYAFSYAPNTHDPDAHNNLLPAPHDSFSLPHDSHSLRRTRQEAVSRCPCVFIPTRPLPGFRLFALDFFLFVCRHTAAWPQPRLAPCLQRGFKPYFFMALKLRPSTVLMMLTPRSMTLLRTPSIPCMSFASALLACTPCTDDSSL